MKKSLQIDDFWKKYLDAVLKRSVPKDKAELYLKWAQKFDVSAPGQVSLSSDFCQACRQAGYRRLLSSLPLTSIISRHD